MRGIGIVLCAWLLACTSAPSAPPTVASSVPATEPAFHVDPGDRQCTERAMNALVRAMNDGDEPTLKQLLASASVGIGEQAAMYPEETVSRLLARSRAGERWVLVQLDVNGRGGAGGVNFAVRLQRTVSGRAVDSQGQGALDCPAGVFLIFYAS